MTDDEWQAQRGRAILAALQTGRAVLADSDGELRYADGSREALDADVGAPRDPLPEATARVTWWTHARRWLRGRS